MHARHVCNLQYRHSKMHQCGPEWQMLQVHWINVLSDLTNLNECAQLVTTAMAALSPRFPSRVGEMEWVIMKVPSEGCEEPLEKQSSQAIETLCGLSAGSRLASARC